MIIVSCLSNLFIDGLHNLHCLFPLCGSFMIPALIQVMSHVVANDDNHQLWPHVVSSDVSRHVHKLKSNVFVVAGHVKGKTLLPLPAGSERVDSEKEEEKRYNIHTILDLVKLSFTFPYHVFYNYTRALLHAIETVVIEWSHQIRNVLKQESAQPLFEGKHPGPEVEIKFWNAKCVNLECIYNQVLQATDIFVRGIIAN